MGRKPINYKIQVKGQVISEVKTFSAAFKILQKYLTPGETGKIVCLEKDCDFELTRLAKKENEK